MDTYIKLTGGERVEGRVWGGLGKVRGERYGKGRKNYQRHLNLQQQSLFPLFLSLENMQHTKTATTCSLQAAPCNNSLGAWCNRGHCHHSFTSFY